MAVTFSASQEGLELVDLNRKEKNWRKDEPAWREAASVSAATLKRFWRGMPIKQESFASICQAVGLEDWRRIVDSSEHGANDITRHVESVIKKRHSIAEAIYPVCQHLEMLLREIRTLNNHRSTLEGIVEGRSMERLHELNFSQIESLLTDEIGRLQNLTASLSRSTLNIGVVGRKRQGKSSFLQSVSGLNDQVIPAYPGMACTAKISKIYHQDADTEVFVELHSAKTFLEEVIYPYFQKLNLGDLPKSLEEFASYSLPISAKEIILSSTNPTKSESLYLSLKEYHTNLSYYREFLQEKVRRLTIPADEIASYVAQHRDNNGHLVSFNHFAVREIEIFCRFPRLEAANIGLIDTPGLGDIWPDGEEMLLGTLNRELDTVIIIRRPDPVGDQWQDTDLMLYEFISKALPDVERRAFILLNRQQTAVDNLYTSQFMKETVGRMRVVNCLIADCSDAEDTNQVLDEVVQYLSQHVLSLEENQVISCQNRLFEIHETLKRKLDKAQLALALQTDERRLLRTLFPKLFENLAASLIELANNLHNSQENKVLFLKSAKYVLSDCEEKQVIPSVEEIRSRLYDPSIKGSPIVLYLTCITELRIDLAKKFSRISNALDQTADRLKLRVIEILVERANLGGLFASRDVNFLTKFVGMLSERGSLLEYGFRKLLNFTISYESIFLQSVRQILVDKLTFTSNETITSEDNLTPELLHEKLQKAHIQVVDKFIELVEERAKILDDISYSMMMEFLDYVLYDKDALAEWEILLEAPDIRSKIWVEFQKIEAQQKIQLQWLSSVKRIQELNQRQAVELFS